VGNRRRDCIPHCYGTPRHPAATAEIMINREPSSANESQASPTRCRAISSNVREARPRNSGWPVACRALAAT
jgi:hypothetical protein